jgi:ABC-2 type transport system permease protein
MSWTKVFAVIRREYLERVRTKAFWFATFLVPIFFLGYMGVQFAAIKKTSGERRVAVIDRTGQLAEPLLSMRHIYEPTIQEAIASSVLVF